MAFTLTNTTTPTSPFRPQHHKARRINPGSLGIETQRVSCTCSSPQNGKEMNRQNVLIGLGSLCGIATTAKAANAGSVENDASSLQPVYEFGSQPRALDKAIRALVDLPNDKSDVVILAIDDIDIANAEPVRFDVYITKPVGNMVIPDYGVFVGSEVDVAHVRNNKKGLLELGITYILEDMGAEDSNKLVVTLVPRTGKVNIGSIRIETT